MRCPVCSALETRVLETRTADEGRVVRRRRVCPDCGTRFTTYEKTEYRRHLRVIKKDGTREAFDRDKIIRGLVKACEKLPVPLEQIEELASGIETELNADGYGEVPVDLIGQKVMDGLKRMNKVAYVRFASVYREFTDLETFQHEIARLISEKDSREGAENDEE
ncbi:MAG: transcriptional repressor NrdR [Synergistaceae bacterium]|nr:transcriptional regulator NrdR [Synergistota bacterium]NLM72311.1 transcriptional repressor NrdR [Synergistaceae bacterium]